jgi:hypothetical protein
VAGDEASGLSLDQPEELNHRSEVRFEPIGDGLGLGLVLASDQDRLRGSHSQNSRDFDRSVTGA